MAMLPNSSRSSSNYHRSSNTQASAYVVDVPTMALTGFHYSTSPGGGLGKERSRGAFEGGSGPPSPPSSPSSSQGRPSLRARRRSGDAAYNISEECERLFCETLQSVFLVERNTGRQNSLEMDMRNNKESVSTMTTSSRTSSKSNGVQIPTPTIMKHDLPTPSPSPDGRIYPSVDGMVKEYVEVWDYVGGARFRGFVAEKRVERSLFIFFDSEVIGQDLKPGLMALLELASSDEFACDQLVVCVDRHASAEAVTDVARNLKWVGCELTTLDAWAETDKCISTRWLFLGMDL